MFENQRPPARAKQDKSVRSDTAATYEREVTAALVLWADHMRAIVENTSRKIVPIKQRA
jgi:hypothetical protein